MCLHSKTPEMDAQLSSCNICNVQQPKSEDLTNNFQNGNTGDDERDRSNSASDKSPDRADENPIERKTDSDSGKRSHESLSGDENDVENVKKKKHRRKAGGHRRRWKPFEKMSWTERKELEDRQAKRAEEVREERFHKGQPMAPFNTTQFVMADHNEPEPDFNGILNHSHPHHRNREMSLSSQGDYPDGEGDEVGGEDFYSSPSDEEEFLEKDFSEEYEMVHAERLQNMSKDELVQDYLQMEEKLESLQRTAASTRMGGQNDITEQRLNEINSLRSEIRRLREDNERLMRENSVLQQTCNNSTIQPQSGASETDMALEWLDRTIADNKLVPV